jgi:hypothetical protein
MKVWIPCVVLIFSGSPIMNDVIIGSAELGFKESVIDRVHMTQPHLGVDESLVTRLIKVAYLLRAEQEEEQCADKENPFVICIAFRNHGENRLSQPSGCVNKPKLVTIVSQTANSRGSQHPSDAASQHNLRGD